MTLRILLAGNGPWVGSGYGQQLNLIGHSLRDLGADVAYVANFGLNGGMIEWDGFPVYPPAFQQWSDDIIDQHARHFKADLMLTLMDVWPLLPDLGYRGFPWIPLIPIDSTPVAVQNLIRLQSAFQVGAISKWGQDELKAAGVDSVYLPHGFEPRHYFPDPGDRGDLKEKLGFPRDCFLVGMVAANKGWPSRKSFSECFEAFARFAERHDDAYLYLHSLEGSQHAGPNLREMAVAYGIADRVRFIGIYYLIVGADPEDMRQTYSAIDVLLSPSMGEGFGVPVIESQACFPADTPIQASGIVDTMTRLYTGELIRIETPVGAVEATADHPFWSDNGWYSASELEPGCQLLYNPVHAEQGLSPIHAGRIGDVVTSLQGNAATRSRTADGEDLQFSLLAEATAWPNQVVFTDQPAPRVDSAANSPGIFGGTNRWGGHRLNSTIEGEVETSHSDSKHLFGSFGLAISECSWPIDLYRTPKDPRGQTALLHVSHRGDLTSSSVQIPNALYGHQARSDAPRSRIFRTPIGAEPYRSTYAPPGGNHLRSSGAQYQAITSIERRHVTDLPVYNLTTRDSVYYAGGFLVHNCGTPVIVSDFSAQPELCGAGWLVKPARKVAMPLGNFMVEPSVDGIVEALEDAYVSGPNLRQQAAAFAERYAQPNIAERYWKPWLADVERRLLGPAVGAVREARGHPPVEVG